MRAALERCGGDLVPHNAEIDKADEAFGKTFKQLIDENGALTVEMTYLSRRLSTLDAGKRDGSITPLLKRAAHWELQFHIDQLWDVKPEAGREKPYDPLPLEILQGFLQSVHPDGNRVKVQNMRRAEGGSGKQTFLFDLVDGSGKVHDLVVRKSDKVQMVTRDTFVIEREYHLLKALWDAGYKVAQPLWFGKSVPGTDGNFIVMERLPGAIPGTFLDGAQQIPEAYLLDLAELLAKLHKIELEKFADYIYNFAAPSLLTETVEECCRRNINEWRQYAAETKEQPQSPVTEYLLDWLGRNVPQHTGRPVMVHGDFNIHNILAHEGRVSGVLDWECSLFGAPEHDLAYIRPHISKHIDWDKFVAHYLKSGGRPLDTSSFDFYNAYAIMRILHGVLRSGRNLEVRATSDNRLFMVQLGYIVEFMRLALGSTTD
jgi:aminoglycoside phosphotransferase (APT) family kinase protein